MRERTEAGLEMTSCILELRARIEALEAAQQPQDKLDRLIALDAADDGDPIVMSSSPADSLVAPRPLKERPDFIAGYREGLADRKRITEHEEAEQPPTALAQPEPVAPTIQPVPVSERLPGPEDCDSEGRCWMFDPCDRGWWAYRSALPSDDELGRPPWTHWLPYWALPVPADTINQEANDNESSSK
jgi:hypothetical protein